jgi:archaeosine-15-forming tRNA-guanine transglycosylase
MAGRIIQDDFKMKIMDLECNKSVEEAIEQGKNITIKEIIEKKEYPVKYKGNEDIIWLNKEELYLFG